MLLNSPLARIARKKVRVAKSYFDGIAKTMGHRLAVSRDRGLVALLALHMKAPETLSRPWGFPLAGQ
jgi:hypothetical protein